MRHGRITKSSTKASLHLYSKTQQFFTAVSKRVRFISCATEQRIYPAFSYATDCRTRIFNGKFSLALSSNWKTALYTDKKPINIVNVRTSGVSRKMHSYVQVLSTPTADTPGTALLLDTGLKSYLFGNIHEGLQRACIQRNAKLSKTSDVFVSGTTAWKNVGGLFGVILTLADANASALRSEAERANQKAASRNLGQTAAVNEVRTKKYEEKIQAFAEAGLNLDDYSSPVKNGESVPNSLPTIRLHGGENLTHVIATGRRFIFRKGMPVEVEEAADLGERFSENRASNPDWADDNIQVWRLPIAPGRDGQQEYVSQEPPSQGESNRSIESELTFQWNEESSIGHSMTIEKSEALGKVKDQELRKFVVSEMFNSQWRLDALVETQLPQVKMPAALWIRDETTNRIERYIPPESGPLPDITVLVRRPWPGAQIEQLPTTTPSKIAMSYIVRHHRQRGRFNAKKAEELNVNQLVWSVLQNGATVKSKDGVTVTPDMVLEPSRPGAGFAIVDLPSRDYVQNLTKRPEFSDERLMDGIQAVFWLLGPSVAQDETFKTFLRQHSNLRHVISASDVLPNYLAFDSSSALVIRLNQIDPKRYGIPIHSNTRSSVLPHLTIDDIQSQNVIEATRNFQMKLEPRFEAEEQKDVQPFMNTRKVLELMPKEVLALAEAAQSEVASRRATEILAGQNLASEDAEIICLGTGSSAPSKYRNVSATLLRVPNHGSYLFDCGEGTLGQLRRYFEPEKLTEVLRDLKMIWISHLHADHHLGTASVIEAWQEVNYGEKTDTAPSTRHNDQPTSFVDAVKEKKLFVFANEHMLLWLKEYSEVEDFGYDNIIPIYAFPATLSNSNFSWMAWNETHVGFRTRISAM